MSNAGRPGRSGFSGLPSATLEQLLLEKVTRSVEGESTEGVGEILQVIQERARSSQEAVHAFREEIQRRLGGCTEKIEHLESQKRTMEQSTIRRKIACLENRIEVLEQRQGSSDSYSHSVPSEARHWSSRALLEQQRALDTMMEVVQFQSSPEAAFAVPEPSVAPSLLPVTRPFLGESLCHSAKEGRVQQVRSLLDAGADIEARDSKGRTSLHCATKKCHVEVVALLLERGADVAAKDDSGSTALHLAADTSRSLWTQDFRSRGRCMALLVEAGAPLESRDNAGSTPLIVASYWGNCALVRALLVAGADRKARDNEGNTPMFITASPEVRSLLRDGANPRVLQS